VAVGGQTDGPPHSALAGRSAVVGSHEDATAAGQQGTYHHPCAAALRKVNRGEVVVDRARPPTAEARPHGLQRTQCPDRLRGHEHTLRQTLIAPAAGRRLDEHDSPGQATVHVLHGRVRLATGDLAAGDLIVVSGARHTLEALEDSAVLLTVSTTALLPIP
jgi:quercetin dioxygenase-like cupin family protein